jgi:hypothetical protein
MSLRGGGEVLDMYSLPFLFPHSIRGFLHTTPVYVLAFGPPMKYKGEERDAVAYLEFW